MRVLTDTNILISALLNPNGHSSQVLKHVSESHQLIISDFIISELRDVTQRKFPHKAQAIEAFLATLTYELVVASISPDKRIADSKDAPILNSAITANVDVIVSGDSHFRNLLLKSLVVLSPSEYISHFID